MKKLRLKKNEKKQAKHRKRVFEKQVAKMEEFGRSLRKDREIRLKTLRKKEKQRREWVKLANNAERIIHESYALLRGGDISENEIVNANKAIEDAKKKHDKYSRLIGEIDSKISAISYSLQDPEGFRKAYIEQYIQAKNDFEKARADIATIMKAISALKTAKKRCTT